MNKNYDTYAKIQRQSAEDLYNIMKHIDYDIALDVGAGTGFLSRYLKNYVALDIDISLRVFHKNFVVGNIEYMPFKDKTFDLVASNFSIHLCDVKSSIKELIRVSKKYVACAIPIEGSLKGWIYDFPKKDEVLTLLEGDILYEKETTYHINLSGRQLLRFINITGKPKIKKTNIEVNPSLIKNLLLKLENSSFNVLSFLLEV